MEDLIDLLGSEIGEADLERDFLAAEGGQPGLYKILEGLRIVSQEAFQDISVNKVSLATIEESNPFALANPYSNQQRSLRSAGAGADGYPQDSHQRQYKQSAFGRSYNGV